LDSYFLFKKTSTNIQQSEKRIHFLHKTYIEFFLAEHLIEHYIHGNLHLLTIGKPSEVTIDFLRGFLELLTLSDEEIRKNYVLFDRSKSNTLFYSLGYEKSSIQNIEEAIEKILSTAYKSFDNENIITVNVINTFFTNLDNSDNSAIGKSVEKLFWKENLHSEINAIENLWISRWISLMMIQLLESKDKIKQNIHKDKVARLIELTSSSIPYYLKSLSFLDLSFTDLRGADLTRADLRRANLTRADLRRANLTRADLRGADLEEADLRGADLEEADLNIADLRRANLEGAHFMGANLSKSRIKGANLRIADLREAKLGDSIPDSRNVI
jgi:uncharacterized protein YjbI with pentapeptide repeats